MGAGAERTQTTTIESMAEEFTKASICAPAQVQKTANVSLSAKEFYLYLPSDPNLST